MDAHAFDVRDHDRMQLLLDGNAMSAWELLRRYGGPLSAARVAVYLGVDEPEAQRALSRLAGAGFSSRSRRAGGVDRRCLRIGEARSSSAIRMAMRRISAFSRSGGPRSGIRLRGSAAGEHGMAPRTA